MSKGRKERVKKEGSLTDGRTDGETERARKKRAALEPNEVLVPEHARPPVCRSIGVS